MKILSIMICTFSILMLASGLNAENRSNDPNLSNASTEKSISVGSDDLGKRKPAQIQKEDSSLFSQQCCKICTRGKACGNSCISKKYRCHKPRGCACDG